MTTRRYEVRCSKEIVVHTTDNLQDAQKLAMERIEALNARTQWEKESAPNPITKIVLVIEEEMPLASMTAKDQVKVIYPDSWCELSELYGGYEVRVNLGSQENFAVFGIGRTEKEAWEDALPNCRYSVINMQMPAGSVSRTRKER